MRVRDSRSPGFAGTSRAVTEDKGGGEKGLREREVACRTVISVYVHPPRFIQPL